LLHLFTPAKNASPFDVNMAYDAGWFAVLPYTDVTLDDIGPLVQDTIFSRSPKDARRTGIFIGGRDIETAEKMLEQARKAMTPPFEVSVCVDPSGAFTTAAAMVAAVERRLRQTHQAEFKGARVLVFGGSGPVGAAAGVLVAKAGADVVLVGHSGSKRGEAAVAMCRARYGVELTSADGGSEAQKTKLLHSADVVLATAKAGVQVLSHAHLASASKLKVAADVNAVPPAGLEGVGVMDDGASIAGSASGAVGIGALAVGNIKYRVQQAMLVQMHESEKPLYLSFEQAFEIAREYAR
jgi:methylene-tetrahydromethanopterin dehydrogenase